MPSIPLCLFVRLCPCLCPRRSLPSSSFVFRPAANTSSFFTLRLHTCIIFVYAARYSPGFASITKYKRAQNPNTAFEVKKERKPKKKEQIPTSDSLKISNSFRVSLSLSTRHMQSFQYCSYTPIPPPSSFFNRQPRNTSSPRYSKPLSAFSIPIGQLVGSTDLS